MTTAVDFIEANEVADRIRGKASFVIVDVRDEEEVKDDGQIKGPVLHLPSRLFSMEANVKDIINDNNLLNHETIVVHCHKSQQRGPYCARLLKDAASQLSNSSQPTLPEIRVLRYGYEGFFNRYSQPESEDEEVLIHYPLK